ncbi:TolC family protein [Luteolibacter sp. GHJ8]|uniref:TolC family protein n=1 Tax=Luteolibacter rhizosphaerae TaxID=2989719 RepID=A0ABT3G5A2_9BACT|nr:TolC family protein [Luteolibacter rhizosphaerae]MCW1915026.1 TolC family protein [Luteolibacter rhizosphaerae]
MHRFIPRAIAAWCAAISMGHAEPGVVISLASVGDRVRAQNPGLAAARLRIREAQGRQTQSGRLSNPELGIEMSHDPRYRERSLEIGFSQRFPVTNRLRLEKNVSATEVKVAQAEVREVERQLIAEARQGIVKVLAVRKRRELLKDQEALSKEFAEFLSGVAEKGEGSPLDAGQAKLEAASLTLEMRQLDASEAAAIGEIKPLLGVRPNEPLHVGGSLPEASLPASAVDPSKRPDFQAAVLGAQAAGQNVAVEQSKRYEDVEAGVFFGAERSEDAPEGYDREGIMGLRFTLPLPLWNKNEGAIEEAKAKHERMEKEASALARGIRLEAEAAKAEMQEWLKLLGEAQNGLLPLADEQAKAAEEAYKKGQGEIQTVFRTREKQVQLMAARLDALREFHLARVRYESALAKP